MRKTKNLCFTHEANKFPEVWEATGDPSIDDLTDSVEKIINKHVYLAIKEFTADSEPYPTLCDETGHAAVALLEYGLAELCPKIDIEDLFLEIQDVRRFDDGELESLIASFTRIVEHLKKLEGAK